LIAGVVRGAGIELDREAPEPRAGDDVLVEMEAACIAPLDLEIAARQFPLRPPEPYVPGLDGAGRVVGDGRRVWIRGGGVGMTRGGCCAERAVVPLAALHDLPEEVDPVTAATFFVPCGTAHAALHDVGGVRRGETVAVRGAGGSVGRVTVQMALAAGAEVIGIDRETRPDELQPASVELLIDTVGGPSLAEWLPAMRPRGRIALVGYAGGTRLELDALALLVHDVSLLPVNGASREPDTFPLAGAWLAALVRGELAVPATDFPIDRLDQAVAAVTASPSCGRVAVTFR
jgi:NADPH:quinone reductase-like Zn-dependent oxidoreductase